MASEATHILMVDDEEDFSSTVKDFLQHKGNFIVSTVKDGSNMWQHINAHPVDLFIMDVMLHSEDGKTGLDLAKELRAEGHYQPILVLSCNGEEHHRIEGLNFGADDYVAKPPSMSELLARVNALLRRVEINSAMHGLSGDRIHRFGPFEFNLTSHSLRKNNKEVFLTPAEFMLLSAFVSHPNKILTRSRLTKLVKGDSHVPFDRGIDVNVRRLRCKIEDNPSRPIYIRTMRGEGYLFSLTGKLHRRTTIKQKPQVAAS